MLRRVLTAAVVLPAVLLGAVGCQDSDEGSAAGTPSASSSSGASSGTSSSPALTPAGRSEAAVLAGLPNGPATGTTVLTITGAGELRAPFSGECSTTSDTMRLDGQADTARIRLDAGADGVRLQLDDVGLSATSDLATGRYDVSGRHLSLAAPLVQDGQSVGSLELELDCGS